MVMQNTLAEILSLVHIWVEHIQKIDHMHLPKKKKFLKIELKLHLMELTNISHYNYIIQSYDKTVVNQFYVEFKVNGPSSKM